MHAGSLSKLAVHTVVYLGPGCVVRALRNCGCFCREKNMQRRHGSEEILMQ